MTSFGATPAVQTYSIITKDDLSSEEEENNLSSFLSTLVITDAVFSLFLTF